MVKKTKVARLVAQLLEHYVFQDKLFPLSVSFAFEDQESLSHSGIIKSLRGITRSHNLI